ncbi:hypothetical protein G6F64_015255 [Rhizopus arrhizus]|uniref:Uncharacterized protein n=1 Tax=Rhizopus oryzae TaxID=64495 RepID=A0A9P6WRY7_RHIOR|nr:hypothetical protein G6F64_015255 [Rhizopus arrhizus]
MMVGWMDTLLSYDFDIIHIPGVQNVLPDALSRLFPPEKELAGSDSNSSTVKHQNQESSDRKIDHHEGFVKNAVTANTVQTLPIQLPNVDTNW